MGPRIPDAFRIGPVDAEGFRIVVAGAPGEAAEPDVLSALEDAVEDDLGQVARSYRTCPQSRRRLLVVKTMGLRSR